MKFNKKTMQKIGLGALVMGAMLLIGNVAMASDTGAWTSLSVSGNLSDNLTLSVGEELRFGDITDPSLVRQHTDIGITSKVSDIVNVGVGYRNVSTGEQRVSVSLGLRLLTGTINLDSLSKLELRDGDAIRGRTSITAATAVAGVTPWLTEEAFVDDSGVVGNRVSIGVTKGIDDTFSIAAYYLLDTAGTDFANSSHVLGLGLGVSL